MTKMSLSLGNICPIDSGGRASSLGEASSSELSKIELGMSENN